MKKFIGSMFSFIFSTMAQSQVIDVTKFEERCQNFIASYNASPGSEITINYTDVLGKAVSAKIKTRALPATCVTNSKRVNVKVVKDAGTYYEFVYTYEYNDEGVAVRLSATETCTNSSVINAYIAVLKNAGIFVDQNVNNAVQRMFSESVCPAVDREIQSQISKLLN